MRRPLSALLLTALAASSLYAVTVGYGFVWDDRFLILENRYLRDWSELGNNLTSDFFRKTKDTSFIGYWRPVVTLSYMIDLAAFDDEPWGFHLRNVVLHALTSCVLLWLAWRLPLPRGVALGGSLLFAAHPVHVESVAWISGRTDLFCTLFALGAVALDLEHARSPHRLKRVGSVAGTVLALLSKEMAAVLPAVVFLRAVWLPGEGQRRRTADAGFRAALPHGLAVAAYLVLRFGVLEIATKAPASAEAGRWVMFLTWWSGFLEYVRVLVWPSVLTVAPMIDQEHSVFAPRVLAGLVLAALAVLWTWRLRRREPAVAFTLATFLVCLVPLTNFIVPVNAPSGVPFTWAERFLYLPSAGFCLTAAWIVLAWLPRRVRRASGAPPRQLPPRWAVAVLTGIFVAFSARTAVRVSDWKDDLALFESAARLGPDSKLARLNYGVALADRGRLEAAEGEYVATLGLDPGNYQAHFNLGNLHRQRGDLLMAEVEYRAALETRPSHAQSHLNLGLTLLSAGKVERALEAFARADHFLPDHVDAKVNRANALRLLGRFGDAVPLYREALALEPGLREARLGLAGVYLATGREERGLQVLDELLEDEPDFAEGHLLRAIHLERGGRTAEAEREYRRVLELDPDNDKVRRRLGLATPDAPDQPSP